MGKIETHIVNGKPTKLCVHRKGATRAFGPHSPGLPLDYETIGQPVFVPGSMGSNSWVLVGTEEHDTILGFFMSWSRQNHESEQSKEKFQRRNP